MSAVSSGVMYIHSSPRALTSHVEWAVSRVLGKGITFTWDNQPALPRCVRTEYSWQGPAGSGAALASALFGWEQLRFEITEDAVEGSDPGRWSHTPSLGLFHGATDAAGNLVIAENRLQAILDFAGNDADLLRTGIERSLGSAWDKELEVFRYASDVAPVRWLHNVG